MTFFLALALACAASGNDAKAETPLVLRSYDISAAQPWGPAGRSDLALVPLLVAEPLYAERGEDHEPGPEELLAQLEHLYGAELQQEGRSLELRNGNQLLVRAPEAVHQGVAQLLEFWENAFAASTELTIDCVRLEGPGLTAPSAWLSIADADRMLGALPAAAQRRTFRVVVSPGETGSVDLTSTQRLVTEFDCEIAQEAGVLDPVVEAVPSGLRIDVRCAPAPGGHWLALVQRDVTSLGVREMELRTHALIATEAAVEESSLARKLQGADLLDASIGLNAFLPEGKALVVQTSLGVETGRASTLFVVRAAGPAPAREYHLALAGLGRRGEIDAYAWGFSAPPRMVAKGYSEGLERFALRAWRSDSDETRALAAGLERGEEDALLTHLSDEPAENHTVWGPYLVVRADPDPVSDGAKRREVHTLVAARLAPTPRTVQVTLTLRRAHTGGEPLARAVLPVRIGEQGLVVLGTESHRVCDYSVEVAQKASIGDPVVCDTFDGFVGIVRPRPAAAGGLALELYGEAHVQRGPSREFDPRASTLSAIWEADFDELSLRERVVFPKDARAPRTVVLGDAGTSGPGGLQLEIEVAELR